MFSWYQCIPILYQSHNTHCEISVINTYKDPFAVAVEAPVKLESLWLTFLCCDKARKKEGGEIEWD